MQRIIGLFFLVASCLCQAQSIKPAKLGLCVACHGESGTSRIAGTPHLTGQDEAYLRKALNDYRSGARKVVPMSSIANQLQPKDIAQLAKWYAAQASGFQKNKK
jgi:cytochrome c553